MGCEFCRRNRSAAIPERKCLKLLVFYRIVTGFRTWLGGRDSNPDNMLQRHASYRWTTSQCRSARFPDGRELLIIAQRPALGVQSSVSSVVSDRYGRLSVPIICSGFDMPPIG
jgi:hypothetical protein